MQVGAAELAGAAVFVIGALWGLAKWLLVNMGKRFERELNRVDGVEKELNEHKVHVAGSFVPRREHSDSMKEVNEKLARMEGKTNENLATGAVCSEDDPNTPVDPTNTEYRCFFGQQFMINSMFYPFLLRMLLNYGDIVHDDDGASVLRRSRTWPGTRRSRVT